MLVEDNVTIAVQVNGKLRGTLDVPKGADADFVRPLALALPAVAAQLGGQEPRKFVYVTDRIANVVVQAAK